MVKTLIFGKVQIQKQKFKALIMYLNSGNSGFEKIFLVKAYRLKNVKLG